MTSPYARPDLPALADLGAHQQGDLRAGHGERRRRLALVGLAGDALGGSADRAAVEIAELFQHALVILAAEGAERGVVLEDVLDPRGQDSPGQRVGNLLAGTSVSRVPATTEVRADPGRLIVVFSTKGGVGKSTIAINVAATMTRLSQERVALVDADLQFGDVAVLLGIPPQHSIADAAASILEDATAEAPTVDATVIDEAMVKRTAATEDDPPAASARRTGRWRGSGYATWSPEWRDWCAEHFPNSFDPKTGTIMPYKTGVREPCL